MALQRARCLKAKTPFELIRLFSARLARGCFINAPARRQPFVPAMPHLLDGPHRDYLATRYGAGWGMPHPLAIRSSAQSGLREVGTESGDDGMPDLESVSDTDTDTSSFDTPGPNQVFGSVVGCGTCVCC